MPRQISGSAQRDREVAAVVAYQHRKQRDQRREQRDQRERRRRQQRERRLPPLAGRGSRSGRAGPGRAQAPGVHAGGAAGGDARVQAGDGAGRGRVRAGLQGLGRRAQPQPGQELRRRRRRRQEAQLRERPGPPRMAVGGELSGQAAAPEPGEAAGVLRRGPGAAPRLRVHAQGQPREPPLPAGRRLRAAAVGHAAQDRRRRRARPRLPALAGDADHLPGLQGLQHPPRRRLQPQALGLWARQERARGGPLPRHHAGHRHLRLRGARVRRHGTPLRQERRLRLRRRPPRAAHGASGARHQQAQPPGEPRGVGAALHRRREEAHQPHGPAAGGAVPAQGRAPGCQARAPLPLRRPQVQACHGRRAGKAGGDRGHGGVERRAATQACNGGGAATVAVPWFLQALTVTHRSIRLCL